MATAFDEIAIQPSGHVRMLGSAAEVRFFAGLLDKVDVEADIDRRHECNSAADLLTQRGFTSAHHRAVDRIVASHHERLIAAARGLVDRLGGYHEALESARRLAGLPPRAPLRVRVLPRQSLAQRLGLQRADLDDVVKVVGAATGMLRDAELAGSDVASMPGWTHRIARRGGSA